MSVEFEPIRLGHRRRRIDPLLVGVVVVAVALGAAVFKPWGDEAPATGGSSPIAVAEASPTPAASEDVMTADATPSIALPRVIRANPAATLTWSAVEPIVHWHDAWGVRAIVVQPLADTPMSDRDRLVERWYPLVTDRSSSVPTRVDSNDRSIAALGLTFPPTQTPLDVRFWRETSRGLDWVDTRAIDPVPSRGAFLFVRPGVVDGLQRPWEPGTYRIDALVEGSVRRFGISIPNRFSNVPASAERPSLRDNGPLTQPESVPLSDLPVGLFATSGHRAEPIAAVEGGPLDEAGAWLNVDPGTGRRPRSFVATTYLPRATGLGVALPADAIVSSAAIERLAPEPLSSAPDRVDPGAQSGPSGSVVLFEAPDGAWAPGTYRLSIDWADSEGAYRESWHAELRPGPLRAGPPMLAAARAWARFAGATGVILGTPEPLSEGGTGVAIELVPLRPESAEYPVSSGIGCGGTVIGGRPGILGFAYEGEQYATSVKGRILRPYLRRDDQVLMTSALGIPGLILAAPARTSTLPAATYEFRVGRADAADVFTVCLGMALFDD
jgi:hypothetical protein